VNVASRPSTRASKLPVTQLVFVSRGVFLRRRRACVLFGVSFLGGYSPKRLPGDTAWFTSPPTGWGWLGVLSQRSCRWHRHLPALNSLGIRLAPWIEEDDVADDDIQTAVMRWDPATLYARRALRLVRGELVRRRVGGSRPGRRLYLPCEFDPGAYAVCETTSVWTGSRRSMARSRLRIAFVNDDGPTCGALLGAPGPLSVARLNDRQGCQNALVGTAWYMRMAETKAKDAQNHITLHNALVEHMWAESASRVSPDVRLSDVGWLRRGVRGAEVEGRRAGRP